MLDPQFIKKAANELYLRHDPLRSAICGEDLFPWAVTLPRLDSRTLLENFTLVRNWISGLEDSSASRTGHGYLLEYEDISHRQLGKQKIPRKAVFTDLANFIRFIERQADFESLLSLVVETKRRMPALLPLLQSKPALLLEGRECWGQVLAVSQFFIENPRPGEYLRELEISGVDTKFIEGHKKLLATFLDHLLPESAIDASVTSLSKNGFEKRYGLRIELPRLRLRVLCDSLKRHLLGMSDIQLPVHELASMDLPCKIVFVTENKTNGLAFPAVPGAVVIFGLGHAIDLLTQISWLNSRKIFYLGDIDTHGFLILSRFRKSFPHVQSMLMDKETLLSNQRCWGEEGSETAFCGDLENLTSLEEEVFSGLRSQAWGKNLRLEQERISFSQLKKALIEVQV